MDSTPLNENEVATTWKLLIMNWETGHGAHLSKAVLQIAGLGFVWHHSRNQILVVLVLPDGDMAEEDGMCGEDLRYLRKVYDI